MKYTKKIDGNKPTKSIEKRIQKNESSTTKAKAKKSFNAPKDTKSLLSQAELNSEGIYLLAIFFAFAWTYFYLLSLQANPFGPNSKRKVES